jgi:hypothetical protein
MFAPRHARESLEDRTTRGGGREELREAEMTQAQGVPASQHSYRHASPHPKSTQKKDRTVTNARAPPGGVEELGGASFYELDWLTRLPALALTHQGRPESHHRDGTTHRAPRRTIERD